MKAFQLLVISFPLLAGGCAMDRYVEVRAARSVEQTGLTRTVAAEVFRQVAEQLGFEVEGPIQVSRNLFQYAAHPPGKRRENRTSLIMWGDDQIRFESGVHGSEKDVRIARQAATLFEEALDKRGVHYEVRTGKMIIPP